MAGKTDNQTALLRETGVSILLVYNYEDEGTTEQPKFNESNLLEDR